MSGKPLGSIPSVDDMLGRINDTRARMEEDEEFRKELEEGQPSGNPITLGPRLPSAEDWAALQVKGAEDNAQKWLDRTTKPKKNFKEEALRPTAVERYKDSMRKVIDEDRHAGGMALVDESETMAIIKEVGAEGYKKGVRARKAKIRRVVGDLREDRLALCAVIDALPVSTDGEREEKMLQNKRGLQAIGAKRRGA